jgi:hypothetical protein
VEIHQHSFPWTHALSMRYLILTILLCTKLDIEVHRHAPLIRTDVCQRKRCSLFPSSIPALLISLISCITISFRLGHSDTTSLLVTCLSTLESHGTKSNQICSKVSHFLKRRATNEGFLDAPNEVRIFLGKDLGIAIWNYSSRSHDPNAQRL